MSRKSSVSVPGGATRCHDRPPSTVLRMVPFEPLAHATWLLTADSARNRASLFVVVGCQVRFVVAPAPGGATRNVARTREEIIKARFMSGQHNPAMST